jgi:hypothetical protein
MGERYQFKCERCGLSAVVSGGPDSGFLTETKTVFCRTCGILQDIVTWVNEDDLKLMPPSARDEFKVTNTCGECKSADLVDWGKGGACPKCGGSIQKNGNLMELWD